MPTFAENLKTRRTRVARRLAELETDGLDIPTAGGGGSVEPNFVDYKRSLYEELKELDALIAEAEDADRADGGVGFITSQIRP